MRKDRKNQEIIDAYDYLSNAASSQDLTGLIPSAPHPPKSSNPTKSCIIFSRLAEIHRPSIPNPASAKKARKMIEDRDPLLQGKFTKERNRSYTNQKRSFDYAFYESGSRKRNHP